MSCYTSDCLLCLPPPDSPPTHKLPSACVLSPPGTHTGPGLQVYTHHTHTQPHIPAGASEAPALGFSWPSAGGHVLQRNVNVQHLPVNQL